MKECENAFKNYNHRKIKSVRNEFFKRLVWPTRESLFGYFSDCISVVFSCWDRGRWQFHTSLQMSCKCLRTFQVVTTIKECHWHSVAVSQVWCFPAGPVTVLAIKYHPVCYLALECHAGEIPLYNYLSLEIISFST